MSEAKYDIIVAGAGIVGLSTGYNLLSQNPNIKLLILDKESIVAKHQTGHNSGVIHSGIYYKPDSLKAINCVKGYDLLLEFCKAHKIPHKICGKIIAARNNQETNQLHFLKKRGEENGLSNLRLLTPKEVLEKEPYLKIQEALWVPQTGVVDFKQVAQTLKKCIVELGGHVKLNSEIDRIETIGTVYLKNTSQKFIGEKIISCVGIQSDRIVPELTENLNMKIIPFRGEYFKILPHRNDAVKGLIYPVPNLDFPFLGVHFTKGIDNTIEIGPNAILALAREGYKNKYVFSLKDTYDTLSYSGFYQLAKKHIKEGLKELKRSFSKKVLLNEIQSFIPSLTINDIQYVRSGIRAQVCDTKGNLLDDFSIIKKEKVVLVLNAPSPAATSCLSIGEYISKKI